jgi:thiamine biosynthesis lipoprotein
MSALPVHRLPFQAMGSACEVVIAAPHRAEAERLAQLASDEVLRIEHKYSRYREDSVLAHIHAQAGGAPVACDEETWSLLQYARQLYEKSEGLFDITSGVLRRAWDFKQGRVPTPDQLQECLALVGWPQIEWSERSIRLPHPGMELDLGGFGKEYAADRAAALLEQAGVRHGYVNLAGDMRFIGPKPDGQAWSIGIQHPRARQALVATIPMAAGGLATSGDYERFFEHDGRRYCHILHPRTGMPVSAWQTVSVMAPLAVLAGCCSTIALLHQERAIDFLQSTGFDYLAVDRHGVTHTRPTSTAN